MEDDVDISQTNSPLRASKNTKTETIQGVLVAMFRISDANMMAPSGSAVLPMLNPKDDLAQKLMRQSYTENGMISPNPQNHGKREDSFEFRSIWGVDPRSSTIPTDGYLYMLHMQLLPQLEL